MKNKSSILAFTILTAISFASCGRSTPPVTAEEQAPEAVPVRESAWRAAPAKGAQPAANTAPAPAAAPAPRYDAPVPTPAPVAARPAAVVTKQPMQVTLPAGSVLAVRVGESMSSEKNQSGESWSGTLAEPVVINGLVIADRGARVDGRVTNVKRAGRVKGVAQLSIALNSFHTADGQTIDVNTGSFAVAGKDETKKDVGKVAIATGIGAAVGAIIGKGKGAAIGAGSGAAAGTGAVLVMRGGPAVIGNEALVRFTTTTPVTITERLK